GSRTTAGRLARGPPAGRRARAGARDRVRLVRGVRGRALLRRGRPPPRVGLRRPAAPGAVARRRPRPRGAGQPGRAAPARDARERRARGAGRAARRRDGRAPPRPAPRRRRGRDLAVLPRHRPPAGDLHTRPGPVDPAALAGRALDPDGAGPPPARRGPGARGGPVRQVPRPRARRGAGRRRARRRPAPAARAAGAVDRAGARRGVHGADAPLAGRARLAAAADGRGGRGRERGDRQPLVLPALRRLGHRTRARPRARRARAVGAPALRRPAAVAGGRDRRARRRRGDARGRRPALLRHGRGRGARRRRRRRAAGPHALAVVVVDGVGARVRRVRPGRRRPRPAAGAGVLAGRARGLPRRGPGRLAEPDRQHGRGLPGPAARGPGAHHRDRLVLLVRLGPGPLRARRRPAPGVQRPPRVRVLRPASGRGPRRDPRGPGPRGRRVLPHDHVAAPAPRPHGERGDQRRRPARALHAPGTLVTAVGLDRRHAL
ncbi:MAG: hypothetical protein AVDCRST_MAG54-1276, partial [uncultured Actinomycetospora sp.]